MPKSFKQFVSEHGSFTDLEVESFLNEDVFSSISAMIKREVETDIKPLKSKVKDLTSEIDTLVAKVAKIVRGQALEDLKLAQFSDSELAMIKKILNNTDAVVRQLVGKLLDIDLANGAPLTMTNVRTGEKS